MGTVAPRPVDEIAAAVDAALTGYGGRTVPYLALFGLDPGDGYAAWLAGTFPEPRSNTGPTVTAPFGHYPHLVDPDRFVARLGEFWDD